MKNPIRNHGGLFSRSTTLALVLLLILASWTTTASARKIELDWPKVQAVKPGTPIKVVLHKDRGPRGDRKIRGRFQWATDDSLTLVLKDGQRHTFPKSAVRKVLTRRPVWKRYQVWLTLGISVALGGPFISSDLEPATIPVLIGLSTLVALVVTPAMDRIYNVPPKY